MRSTPALALFVLFVGLFASGCDKAKDMWSSVAGDQAGGTEGDVERELELERERAELARLEAERREREQLAAETRRVELERADALVREWADRLAEAKQADNNAFVPHEGLTADDPWAKQLRVEYTAEDDVETQTLEVRSAGPNGTFGDDDDLVRARTTQIERGWWERNKAWAIGAFIWLGLGFISAGGVQRRRRRKRGTEDESLDAADILLSLLYIVFAPLTMLFWLVVTIIEVVGEIAS